MAKNKTSGVTKIFSTKAQKINDDQINKITNVIEHKESVSTTKVIIFIIIIIISVLISLEDIITSGIEAAADCATVGVAGIIGGPVDLADEVISELIQDILIMLIAIPMSGGSTKSIIVRLLIVGGCSVIDIIVSLLSLFIPCVADVAATIVEIFTEIIQNATLIYSFYKMFP